MSKQTATERLRELLDEHDEYYGTAGNKTWWGRPIDAQTGKPINVFHNFAQPMGEDRLYVELQLATPEQAIAVTLGNDEIDELKDDYCTLIRENKQLQAKVIAQSDHINKLRGEYKALDEQMECRCAEYRATIRKLKAELDAATLGRGTCHMEPSFDEPIPLPVQEFECSNCGGFCQTEGDTKPTFCPNCGAEVVE